MNKLRDLYMALNGLDVNQPGIAPRARRLFVDLMIAVFDRRSGIAAQTANQVASRLREIYMRLLVNESAQQIKMARDEVIELMGGLIRQ